MQDDIVNFLKGTNKLLGFLEAHAGGLYKTLKLIGISLLAFAGIMTLINLPGTILALGEAVELLVNIRKNLLMIQLMSAGMAGAAGIEAGATAGILLFLTQPAIWVPLAIAALGAVLLFVLKKFFPNIYNNIYGWWLDFKYEVIQFMGRLMETPFMKTLTAWFKSTGINIGDSVKESQKQGGLFRGEISLSSPIMPREPARNYLGGMRLTRQGLEKVPEYGPPVRINKIDASIHIDGTGIDNPEKAAQVIREATESSYSKIMRNIAKSIPNSKTGGLPPFSLSGALNQ